LLCGAFSPLQGFMNRADYDGVCTRMRLANGLLWPIPITLDVAEEVASRLETGSRLALRDPEGEMLAVLHVGDRWELDRESKAQAVYGTLDRAHPGVRHLYERTNNIAVGGRLEGLRLPAHYDFVELRRTPAEMRERFRRLGWRRIIAFQTRNPLHRAHVELTLRAVRQLEANLLIHPVVGMTKPGDVDHYTRVRCYQAVLPRYPQHTAMLSLLPLAMRMGGPREALLHAIIRKNYGCTHLIVGRDHAGPGKDSAGRPFYDPYAAQELVREHEKELGIGMVPFRENGVRGIEKTSTCPGTKCRMASARSDISGSELRSRLAAGARDPAWFTYPEVAAGAAQELPTALPAGLHGVLHRTLRRRQVDHRQGAPHHAPRDRRPAGHAPGRRHRPQAPVFRGSGSARSTATSTFAASGSSPPRSPRTAASPSARRSRRTRGCAARCVR